MEECWPIPIPLHRLRAGTTCTLYALHTAPAMKRRLQDLGLVPEQTSNACGIRNAARCCCRFGALGLPYGSRMPD